MDFIVRRFFTGIVGRIIGCMLYDMFRRALPGWILRFALLFVAQFVIAHIMGIPSLSDLAAQGYDRLFH